MVCVKADNSSKKRITLGEIINPSDFPRGFSKTPTNLDQPVRASAGYQACDSGSETIFAGPQGDSRRVPGWQSAQAT